MQKRISYLAGSWYPKKSESCENAIKDYQKKSKIINDKNLFYKIGIVPHAGWLYSGVLAHSVIYNISRYANPDIIFLAGGHLSFYDNFYFMAECEVETPFGALRCIDDYHNDLTKNLKYKIEEADDYEPDNTTELQLPFLKYYFPNAKIVIVRIPPNETALIFSENLTNLINKKNLNFIFIASSDLTHYGFRFNFMPAGKGAAALDWVKNQNDKSIIDAALNLQSRKILELANTKHNACCSGAIAAAAELAFLLNRKNAKLVDYYTSADVMQDEDTSDFVGYAGIIY